MFCFDSLGSHPNNRSNQCFSPTLVVADKYRQGREAFNRKLMSRGDYVPMHHNRADLHFRMQ